MEGDGVENDAVMLTGEAALELEEEGALEEAEGGDEEMLKKRISGHPLYGLLIQTHLNCLKVGLGDIGEFGITTTLNQAHAQIHNKQLNSTNPTSSDLDKFMEVYCMALSKLKEAMEKPLQETTTFIEGMYDQLGELSVTPQPRSPFQ
ncbi:unnamed protein product [Camellia sinensis]